jgi:hypothetical protein
MIEVFPFTFVIDGVAIASTALWALALYLGLASVSAWVVEQLTRWFNFAERSLYTSDAEFERTRVARESQNAFYASAFSILPFLVVGGLCNYGLGLGLGQDESLILGILTSVGCGVYEFGRRDRQPPS